MYQGIQDSGALRDDHGLRRFRLRDRHHHGLLTDEGQYEKVCRPSGALRPIG